MAFPTSSAPAATNISTAAATHVVNIGSPSAGQLLLALGRVPAAASIPASDYPSGWSVLKDVGQAGSSSDRISVAYKYLSAGAAEIGQATMNVAVDPTARLGAWLVWKIDDAADPAVTAPQISTDATGASTTPDPTSVTPAGGTAKDYLAFWLGGWEGEQTSPPASNPTNYALYKGGADTGTAGAVATNARVAGAAREINSGAAIDPPSWTISVTDDWIAWTVLIHPAPPATTVVAPAATIALPTLFPYIDIVPRLLVDLRLQQFLMFGPAGLRKMSLRAEQGEEEAVTPGDHTVVVPAAIINVPGATAVPEVRVLPNAALYVGSAGAPTPTITILPAAARALALGTGTPTITITPSAATMLGLATGTPTLTILPAAAIARPRSDAPTPTLTILPGAATVNVPGAAPVPEIRVLAPFAPINLPASTVSILVPDRTIIAPAARINLSGTGTPALTILPAAATMLGLATGAPAITILPAAATVNVPGASPVPEIRVLPGAATILASALVPVIIATTVVAEPTTPDRRAEQFLIFGPGARVARVKQALGQKPQGSAFYRVLVAPAATITYLPAHTFGPTGHGALTGTVSTSSVQVSKHTLVEAGSVTKLSMWMRGNVGDQPFKAVIYADSGGVPGALLATGSEVIVSGTLPADTLVDFPFVAPVPLAAGDYHIGFHAGSPHQGTAFYYTVVANGRRFRTSITYPGTGAPDPFGAHSTDNTQPSMYATYQPVPVPEVRVEPAAATGLYALTAPVPEVRVEPGAAIVVYAPGTPTPEIRVLPGAATVLASASGTVVIAGFTTILAPAATINVPGAAPTPVITILPAAAAAAYTATGTPGLVVTPLAARILSAALTPTPEIRVLPSAAPINIPGAPPTILIPGDRLIVPPAARIAVTGTGVPGLTFAPAAARVAVSAGAPTPEVRISPLAARIVGLATGLPNIVVTPAAATILAFGLAPTPLIRIFPSAATMLGQATGIPEVRVLAPMARAIVRQGGFGAQVTTPLITIPVGPARVAYVASGDPAGEKLVIAVPAVMGVRALAPTPRITIVVSAALIRVEARPIVITGRAVFKPPLGGRIVAATQPKGTRLRPAVGDGDIEGSTRPEGTRLWPAVGDGEIEERPNPEGTLR